jgi:hypothetical protein
MAPQRGLALRNNVQEGNGAREPVKNSGIEIDRACDDDGAGEGPKYPGANSHQPARRTALNLSGFREVNLFPKGFEFDAFHRDKPLSPMAKISWIGDVGAMVAKFLLRPRGGCFFPGRGSGEKNLRFCSSTGSALPPAGAYSARPRLSALAFSTGTKLLTICWIDTRAEEALALIAATTAPRESTTGIAIDRNPISSSWSVKA